jgi:FtsZ-binding cell division protein ZapB
MTNKINGIDVSECCFYNNGKCDNPNGMACNCINNAICYFKELKSTRQINSELISKANAYDKLVILANDRLDIIDRLKQENEELKNKNNDLIEEIASGNIDIAILQKENEELKKLKCKFKEYCTCDIEKYRSALEEIREIAKYSILHNSELNSNYQIILQNINEVLKQ